MSQGRSNRGDDTADETPKTRSYVDALLRGNMSQEQVASLRAEFSGAAAEPISHERLTPQSRPTGEEASLFAPGWQVPSAPPPFDLDDHDSDAHGARTVVRTFSPASLLEEFGELPGLPTPPDDEDDAVTSVRFPGEPLRPPRGLGGEDAPASSRQPFPSIELGEVDDWDLSLPPATPVPPAWPVRSPTSVPAPRSAPASIPTSIPRSAPVSIPAPALTEQACLARLGGPAGVPRVVVSPEQVKRLPLGMAAAFVLAQIDGQLSVEDLLDISSLGRAEALRILHDLAAQGVIEISA